MNFQSDNDKTNVEQIQLERSFQQISEQLTKFYNTCQFQIGESARSYREIEGELMQKDREIESLIREKRAYKVLDIIGKQLARLYNTIYDMPDSESKRELKECITALNSEFANCGITVIYDLEYEYRQGSQRYKVTRVDKVQHESCNGVLTCTKVGFDIAGERSIKAEATEHKYEKGGDARTDERRNADSIEQRASLEYNFKDKVDFEAYLNRDAKYYIEIKNNQIKKMLGYSLQSPVLELWKWQPVGSNTHVYLSVKEDGKLHLMLGTRIGNEPMSIMYSCVLGKCTLK